MHGRPRKPIALLAYVLPVAMLTKPAAPAGRAVSDLLSVWADLLLLLLLALPAICLLTAMLTGPTPAALLAVVPPQAMLAHSASPALLAPTPLPAVLTEVISSPALLAVSTQASVATVRAPGRREG